jgi:hypothetical protein
MGMAYTPDMDKGNVHERSCPFQESGLIAIFLQSFILIPTATKYRKSNVAIQIVLVDKYISQIFRCFVS